jgi:hypothetical protein
MHFLKEACFLLSWFPASLALENKGRRVKNRNLEIKKIMKLYEYSHSRQN